MFISGLADREFPTPPPPPPLLHCHIAPLFCHLWGPDGGINQSEARQSTTPRIGWTQQRTTNHG